MTKSDFALMVVRPILLLGVLCALPAIHAAGDWDMARYVISALALTPPLLLTVLASRRT